MATKIDSAAIGIEVSWSFGDGDAEAVTLPRDAVRAALKRNGFDPEMIGDPNPDKALRKALQLVKGRGKTIVIQEFRRPNKDTPMAVGIYEVKPGSEGGDNVVCGARSRVQGGAVVTLAPEGAPSIPECMGIAHELTRIANSLGENVVNREISDVLTEIGWASGWITRRRNSGGVYFMKSGDRAEAFVQLLQDLKGMTLTNKRTEQFVPQIMEVYPKPLTMALWSESALDQYEAEIANLVDQLKKVQEDDKARDSTLEKRAEECDRLIAQAETHRIFLAGNVETLSAELRKVQAGFRKKLEENRREAREVLEALESLQEGPQKARKPDPAPVTPDRPKKVRRAAPKPLSEMSNTELFEV